MGLIKTSQGWSAPQLEWLDKRAAELGIDRSEFVRRLVDAARRAELDARPGEGEPAIKPLPPGIFYGQ